MTEMQGAPLGVRADSGLITGPTSVQNSTDANVPAQKLGLIAATRAGQVAADLLAAALGGSGQWDVRLYERPAGEALRKAFAECAAVVSFLATGATIRVLAPVLGDKTTDPAVVCVDEARRFAIALLGGHHGANNLAARVADALGSGCQAVVTTASDATGVTALDGFGADLGFTIADPELLAPVGAAVLSGSPVNLLADRQWPLPALPPNVRPDAGGDYTIAISDLTDEPAERTLRYRPRSLVVGVGASRGASADEILETIDAALAAGNLSAASVARLASLDIKASEPGLMEAAARRGWPVEFYPAAQLARVPVPNPSPVVSASTGTASVAEAAARYDGPGRPLADLVVEKVKSARANPMATAAVGRLRARGRLALIGLGPGARDLLAPRAVQELRRAGVVVGLDQYLDQVRDLLRPGTRVVSSGLGAEEERARGAVELARSGLAVALVGSGDAGVYAMASPALDYADGDDIDVVCVPGVTAATAASNVLGAALGHDHCAISLSDLHTPWPVIERRVRAAAEGDFVVSFYNPRSRQRDWQLGAALEILAAHRPPGTPIGWVRNASRADQSYGVTTLDRFDPGVVDMYTVVIVGCSQSRIVAGRFVTPRGYTWAG
jgi:cobalt-precorrin 5A hydrolase/precorrin-3B C17-methyltransferase